MWRPLARKLNVMPADVETKFAEHDAQRCVQHPEEHESIAVLTTRPRRSGRWCATARAHRARRAWIRVAGHGRTGNGEDGRLMPSGGTPRSLRVGCARAARSLCSRASLDSPDGQVRRRPPGQPAAAADLAGRRRCARGRPDRLSHRLGLRARRAAGQPRRTRPDPGDPRARRQAPLHPDVLRLRPARPVRADLQQRVPGDPVGHARPLHVHPPGHRRGAAPAPPSQEAHRRRPHPRPRGVPGAALRAR